MTKQKKQNKDALWERKNLYERKEGDKGKYKRKVLLNEE